MLKNFIADAPALPLQPGAAPTKLTRGAMEAFLESRKFRPELLNATSTKLFVIDSWIGSIDPESEQADQWMVAMTCGSW